MKDVCPVCGTHHKSRAETLVCRTMQAMMSYNEALSRWDAISPPENDMAQVLADRAGWAAVNEAALDVRRALDILGEYYGMSPAVRSAKARVLSAEDSLRRARESVRRAEGALLDAQKEFDALRPKDRRDRRPIGSNVPRHLRERLYDLIGQEPEFEYRGYGLE